MKKNLHTSFVSEKKCYFCELYDNLIFKHSMKRIDYLTPSVEMISVEVEGGFAATGNDLPDYGYGGDLSGN